MLFKFLPLLFFVVIIIIMPIIENSVLSSPAGTVELFVFPFSSQFLVYSVLIIVPSLDCYADLNDNFLFVFVNFSL